MHTAMLRTQVPHWHLYRQPFSSNAKKIALLNSSSQDMKVELLL